MAERVVFTSEIVQKWFQVRRSQLLVAADLPACDHQGLRGGHREQLNRLYLSEVLPRRYQVGRGMVYGMMHRSHESDVVVWDAENFPSLPMLDHEFFFAESVRSVLEVKSRWSSKEFKDVLRKTQAVRDIVFAPRPGLEETLQMMQMDIDALKHGLVHEGIGIVPHHIFTGAIFLRGGQRFDLHNATLYAEAGAGIDDSFPDLLLLLEPGVVVVKQYEPEPHLARFDLAEDCLMVFTAALLREVLVRSVTTEAEFALEDYMLDLQMRQPVEIAPFSLQRMAPSRTPFWRC